MFRTVRTDLFPGLVLSDIAQILGTLIAALIGVVGLAIVLGIERRDRYRGGLDGALAVLIAELAEREIALVAWTEEPAAAQTRELREQTIGGPSAADLEAAVEVACMAAQKRVDRECLQAIREVVQAMRLVPVHEQIATNGMLRMWLRMWRTQEIGPGGLRSFTTRLLNRYSIARSLAKAGLKLDRQ
ncbi:hypothetical protein [Agromyces laixinhei]|uniref:hypothetical protein n=1 Tax=Agromyces laixinhei TaxID=2585717 RepID=UPI0012ED5B6B|nr:hypothetical protein [Agromyces laixinhei]